MTCHLMAACLVLGVGLSAIISCHSLVSGAAYQEQQQQRQLSDNRVTSRHLSHVGPLFLGAFKNLFRKQVNAPVANAVHLSLFETLGDNANQVVRGRSNANGINLNPFENGAVNYFLDPVRRITDEFLRSITLRDVQQAALESAWNQLNGRPAGSQVSARTSSAIAQFLALPLELIELLKILLEGLLEGLLGVPRAHKLLDNKLEIERRSVEQLTVTGSTLKQRQETDNVFWGERSKPERLNSDQLQQEEELEAAT